MSKSPLSASHASTNMALLQHTESKERQVYESLSALIDFINGHNKHRHQLTPQSQFNIYKRHVLNKVNNLIKDHHTSKQCDQFNVNHYTRAIMCATDSRYRNLAILAAIKDLPPEALIKLVGMLREHCLMISRELRQSQKARD